MTTVRRQGEIIQIHDDRITRLTENVSKTKYWKTGLEIATHWSPMRPKIEHWRLNFQNWSPAGDSRPMTKENQDTTFVLKSLY